MWFSVGKLRRQHKAHRRRYHQLGTKLNQGQNWRKKSLFGWLFILHICLSRIHKAGLIIEYLESGLNASLIKLSFKFQTNDKITPLQVGIILHWRHWPQLIFRLDGLEMNFRICELIERDWDMETVNIIFRCNFIKFRRIFIILQFPGYSGSSLNS